MVLRWIVAALHLLALGIGLGAVCARAWGLRAPMARERIPLVLLADTLWGVSALLWISTGLWRAFGGLEKGTSYYLGSHAFWIKMSLLGLILVLEIWPMIDFIRWRMAHARGGSAELGSTSALARISAVQAFLVVAMVFAATAMARGLGY